MKRDLRRGAAIGGSVGLIILTTLGMMAIRGSGPGGPGENTMWFLAYSMLWGMPLTWVFTYVIDVFFAAQQSVSFLYYGVLLLAVIANWVVAGMIVGVLVGGIRFRKKSSGISRNG